MNLLIVKLGAVGDVVMAIEGLARLDPLPDVTWVCGAQVEPLVRASGLVKEILPVNEDLFYRGGPHGRLMEFGRVNRALAFRKFDAAFTAYRSRAYRLISLTVRAERHAFFDPKPGAYHGDAVLDVLRELTGGAAGARRALFPGPGKTGGSWRVALAPGGARNILRDDALRRWPTERYHALAARLLAEGAEVVVTGAPSDSRVRSGMPPGVNDRIGSTDLLGLIQLYRGCDAVVTHDSGPMHLAGLAEVPVVALFGPTRPEEKAPRARVLWGGEKLTCRPCYDGRKYAAWCRKNECLEEIGVDRVMQELYAIRKP
ncbi:MAG: glycosyltransferase family 9 protein [Bdellovibrionales bacterium]|nr:glycosyltransferase family 9 protein [Bdellovibrionales bacterium]